MKKTILLSGILFISAFSNAQTSTSQNSTVEKSVTGAQIGLFGLDIYNEAKLADKIALRSEASLFPCRRKGRGLSLAFCLNAFGFGF